jgi:hypothetical protein
MLNKTLPSEDNNPESKITNSTGSDITLKNNYREIGYNRNKRASKSGIYHELSKNHNEYLDKIINDLKCILNIMKRGTNKFVDMESYD